MLMRKYIEFKKLKVGIVERFQITSKSNRLPQNSKVAVVEHYFDWRLCIYYNPIR